MTEIITRGGPIFGEILVCSKCNTIVKDHLFGLHSCEKCDAWVKDVKWIKPERV